MVNKRGVRVVRVVRVLRYRYFPDEGDDLGKEERANGLELFIGWLFSHEVKALETALVEFFKLADQVKDFIINFFPSCRIFYC